MDGLPNFITHGAPLARFARRSSAINSLLRRIKKQISSEADSSVSTSSRRANGRIIRLIRIIRLKIYMLRRNVDGFLAKFPHERNWFLYFRNVSWDK